METLLEELGEESLDQQFVEELATKFSCSTSCVGQSAIQWKQVENSFQNKLKRKPEGTSLAIVPLASDVDTTDSNDSKSIQIYQGDNIDVLSELVYEAKSMKDEAWYDVGSFLNYRYLSTGELEVRIRFSGFGNDNDEWVNVERGVRERSIPLNAMECYKVNVGDLVLCYQERPEQAVYCDAHVFNIQRKIHDDVKGCKCIFFVRYDHDHTEERVAWTSLCCRPT